MYSQECFLKKFIEKILIIFACLWWSSSHSFLKSETENMCRVKYSIV